MRQTSELCKDHPMDDLTSTDQEPWTFMGTSAKAWLVIVAVVASVVYFAATKEDDKPAPLTTEERAVAAWDSIGLESQTELCDLHRTGDESLIVSTLLDGGTSETEARALLAVIRAEC